MTQENDTHRKLYVGTLDGVCSVSSSNGGRNWEQGQVTPLDNAAARLSVSATQPGRAYLAAYEAGVFRTDDGGSTWRHLPAYPTAYAHSVLAHPAEAETLFVGSEPAAVFRSDDGGDSWTSQTSLPAKNLGAVYFVDKDNGWIALENQNTIRYTTDGGDMWASVSTTSTHPFADIHFVDKDNGCAVGDSGTILHSTDGGMNWTEQPSGTTETLTAVQFIDEDTGWAVGYGGVILKTSHGGMSAP